MAKDKKKALPEGEDQAAPKKKSKKKIIIILFVLLLMFTGVGAGAYWWFFMRNPGVVSEGGEGGEVAAETETKGQDADKGKEEAKEGEKGGDHGSAKVERPATLPRSQGIVVPLPPITVNLMDAGGRRYLKLGMEEIGRAHV